MQFRVSNKRANDLHQSRQEQTHFELEVTSHFLIMALTDSRLVPLRLRSGLPILIKGIIIRVGSGAQFALWILSTPSLLMLKQIRNFVFSLLERGMKSIPWFQNSFKTLSIKFYSLSFLKPSLALLVPAPFLKPSRTTVLPSCDNRFVTLQKSPPKNKSFSKPSKKADKIYDQVLLNSAIRRYRKFLISLSSSQLINLYRASYFRHAKYFRKPTFLPWLILSSRLFTPAVL
ncbi:hypothetical protein DSO57_1032920 [Entomophthora muscae]|uniref:Uncharacterized protein n=1 Tax=Entomophthora muscae TaxID=34485 RepID=A0ACC2SPV4_9FUNG|nr:hypothetical protein DSO57_1032920 [Entomophthora muscae]